MSAGANRAQKTGIAYEVEKKQEHNYDREEEAGTPTHVVNWINAVTQGEHDPIPETEWKAFNTHIKDGVMLCKLVNKLLKSDGKQPVQFQKKVMSPFVAMTNIENFNKGAMAYGLPKEATFQSGDLWEVRKSGFYNVLSSLHQLGFFAKSKGFKPEYTGDIKKTLDLE